MPNPAKPVERKRKLGNPGVRPLPKQVIVAEQVMSAPDPLRPLGRMGKEAWDRVWMAGAHWVSGKTDIQIVQMLCECEDERSVLRHKVLTEHDWHDRVGLRNLESLILSMYSMLGFNPVDRGKLGVGEVRPSSVLDELRLKRERRTGPKA